MRRRLIIDTRNVLRCALHQHSVRGADRPRGQGQIIPGQTGAGSGRDAAGDRVDAAKTILMTGSAGFVGSPPDRALLTDGHTVIGVDNYISGQPPNTALFADHPHFRFIQADVSEGIPYKAGARRADAGLGAALRVSGQSPPLPGIPGRDPDGGCPGHPARTGIGPQARGEVAFWPAPARCTVIRTCTPSRRATGAMSIPTA